MQTVIVEPYRSFKQKMRLTKRYRKLGARIRVYKNYLYIDM